MTTTKAVPNKKAKRIVPKKKAKKKPTVKKAPAKMERAIEDMNREFKRKQKDIQGLDKGLIGYQKELNQLTKLVRAGKYDDAFDMIDGGMRSELESSGIYIEMHEVTGELHNVLDEHFMEEDDRRYEEQEAEREKERAAILGKGKFCPNCGEDLRL